MTWAMHTVGFLDLEDQVEAAKVFERSFSLYTREPFKVWSEVIPGQPGAGNFITGAGGFLQSIINGYGGIRLQFDSLTITNFYVPASSSALEFTGITYLNNRFSMRVVGDEATLTFRTTSIETPLSVTLMPSNIEIIPSVGAQIKFDRDQKLVMKPKKNPFGTCEMKETVLGQRADSTTLKFSSILVGLLALFVAKF
jgi:protein-glucosylgalactosylhydroxylysine glucosidase